MDSAGHLFRSSAVRNKNEIKNENYYLMRYLNGYDGIELDEKMAIKLFRKSAKQDHPSAYYALYKCYTNGRGVRKNRQLALKYLHKSAELGYSKARKVLKKLEETQNEQ